MNFIDMKIFINMYDDDDFFGGEGWGGVGWRLSVIILGYYRTPLLDSN